MMIKHRYIIECKKNPFDTCLYNSSERYMFSAVHYFYVFIDGSFDFVV